MNRKVTFPGLTEAQRQVKVEQKKRADWIRGQVALGIPKARIARDCGISRQALDGWLEVPRGGEHAAS